MWRGVAHEAATGGDGGAMTADETPRRLRTHRGALLRYATAWAAVGVAAAALALLVIRGTHNPAPAERLDPIAAAVASGCVLEKPRGRQARVSRPPVSGPRGRASADGIYETPQPKRRLVAALRGGVIVIQYQPRLTADAVALLRGVFAHPQPRRILTPDASAMPFAVAATAWGRLLGCSKVDAKVLRALREFADRYGGTGPDS